MSTKKDRLKINLHITRDRDKHVSDVDTLALLFKEVLQQIPSETAAALVRTHRQGGTIKLAIFENSRGRGYKTAFATGMEPHRPNEPSQSGPFLVADGQGTIH